MHPFTVFNCRCIPILTEENFVAEKSVYHSSTMGEIPLSFTGRHLLQALREEVQDLVRKSYEDGNKDGRGAARQISSSEKAWEPVSRARGRIAKYMSDLEKKVGQFFLRDVPFNDLTLELGRRGYTVDKKLPPWHRRPASDSINELLDAGFTVSVTQDYRRPPDKGFTVRVDGVVSSKEAQRIGEHMKEHHNRDVERMNQRINIVVNPFDGPFAVHSIVDIKTSEPDALLSEYIVKPRENRHYLRELTFKARNVEAARTRAIKEYGAYGFIVTKEDFDLFVKTRN